MNLNQKDQGNQRKPNFLNQANLNKGTIPGPGSLPKAGQYGVGRDSLSKQRASEIHQTIQNAKRQGEQFKSQTRLSMNILDNSAIWRKSEMAKSSSRNTGSQYSSKELKSRDDSDILIRPSDHYQADFQRKSQSKQRNSLCKFFTNDNVAPEKANRTKQEVSTNRQAQTMFRSQNHQNQITNQNKDQPRFLSGSQSSNGSNDGLLRVPAESKQSTQNPFQQSELSFGNKDQFSDPNQQMNHGNQHMQSPSDLAKEISESLIHNEIKRLIALAKAFGLPKTDDKLQVIEQIYSLVKEISKNQLFDQTEELNKLKRQQQPQPMSIPSSVEEYQQQLIEISLFESRDQQSKQANIRQKLMQQFSDHQKHQQQQINELCSIFDIQSTFSNKDNIAPPSKNDKSTMKITNMANFKYFDQIQETKRLSHVLDHLIMNFQASQQAMHQLLKLDRSLKSSISKSIDSVSVLLDAKSRLKIQQSKIQAINQKKIEVSNQNEGIGIINEMIDDFDL